MAASAGTDGKGDRGTRYRHRDYNLPGGLNGLQTIAELRKALHREIPVIILTGDTRQNAAQDRARALRASQQACQRRRMTGLVRTLTVAQRRPGPNGHEPPLKVHASKPPSAKSTAIRR